MLAAGRHSLEPIRPSGCSSWSPSKRRPPLGEGPWWRSCPNLLQRPGSSRGAREETLIFRASSRGRSRPGGPLQQIWTRSRPGSSQKPHPPHRAKGFAPGRTGTGRCSDPTPGGKAPSFWPAFEYNAIRGAGIFRPGPADLCHRGAPHPGSHSGGTPSFARTTSLGLPKTLGRLGKNSVIGLPNPRESSRPAATTM